MDFASLLQIGIWVVIPFIVWIIKTMLRHTHELIELNHRVDSTLNRKEVIDIVNDKQHTIEVVYELLRSDLERLETKVDRLLEK